MKQESIEPDRLPGAARTSKQVAPQRRLGDGGDRALPTGSLTEQHAARTGNIACSVLASLMWQLAA